MGKMTEREAAVLIEELWEKVKETMTEGEQEKYLADRYWLDHIAEFGPDGPCGVGLGKFGGHAV